MKVESLSSMSCITENAGGAGGGAPGDVAGAGAEAPLLHDCGALAGATSSSTRARAGKEVVAADDGDDGDGSVAAAHEAAVAAVHEALDVLGAQPALAAGQPVTKTSVKEAVLEALGLGGAVAAAPAMQLLAQDEGEGEGEGEGEDDEGPAPLEADASSRPRRRSTLLRGQLAIAALGRQGRTALRKLSGEESFGMQAALACKPASRLPSVSEPGAASSVPPFMAEEPAAATSRSGTESTPHEHDKPASSPTRGRVTPVTKKEVMPKDHRPLWEPKKRGSADIVRHEYKAPIARGLVYAGVKEQDVKAERERARKCAEHHKHRGHAAAGAPAGSSRDGAGSKRGGHDDGGVQSEKV